MHKKETFVYQKSNICVSKKRLCIKIETNVFQKRDMYQKRDIYVKIETIVQMTVIQIFLLWMLLKWLLTSFFWIWAHFSDWTSSLVLEAFCWNLAKPPSSIVLTALPTASSSVLSPCTLRLDVEHSPYYKRCLPQSFHRPTDALFEMTDLNRNYLLKLHHFEIQAIRLCQTKDHQFEKVLFGLIFVP